MDYNKHPTVNVGVTSSFGVTWENLFHAGEDWEGTTSTAIHAIGAGKVMWTGGDFPGSAIVIEHSGQCESVLGVHARQRCYRVSPGSQVARGQVIANGLYDQSYGGKSNVHLHWEVRYFYDASPKFPRATSGVPGPGYTYPTDSYGYTNPSQFVVNHGGSPASMFSDVTGPNFSYAITSMASAGLVSGFSDGTFRPGDAVTRQQFAKMIVKALGLPVSANDVCPFTDVVFQSGDDPLYPSKYVAVCAARGITTGKTGTTFAPSENITRQQLIAMVARAISLSTPPASYTPSFSAAQFYLNEYYVNACKADYIGLLNGLAGPYCNFAGNATRGECAQILYNLLHR